MELSTAKSTCGTWTITTAMKQEILLDKEAPCWAEKANVIGWPQMVLCETENVIDGGVDFLKTVRWCATVSVYRTGWAPSINKTLKTVYRVVLSELGADG